MKKNESIPFKILLLALGTGLAAGVAVTLYVFLCKGLTWLLFFGDPVQKVRQLPAIYLYLIPGIAIYIVHRLIALDPTVREYGVAEIAKAVEEGRFTITFKGLILKIVASSLSLAGGFVVGNEGPSAAIGAMIAYHLNRWFKLSKKYVTLMVSIGASSGIAAVFVSPVTGIAFAIENIAFAFINRQLGPIILGATLAFGVAYLTLEPLVFRYSIGRAFDYEYMAASIFFIPVLLLFLFIYLSLKRWVLHFIDALLRRWFARYRDLFFAVLGGLTIGTILLYAPFAAFSGHEVVAALINNEFHISILLIAIVALMRIFATTLSIYANAVGGLFLPLMSIGALVGYGYAEALHIYLGFDIHPYAFAAIGAAVFMGVIMRLPLTAIVLALEITYDYNVIVSTAITVVFTGYVMNRLFHIEKLMANSVPDLKRP